MWYGDGDDSGLSKTLTFSIMKKISSLSFYPHAPSSILRDQGMKVKILNLTKFFIDQAINAIHSFFIKKTYTDFDAHVGETLCQIRAYKLLLMIRELGEKSEINFYMGERKKLILLQKKVNQKIEFYETLIKNKKSKHHALLDKTETLQSFLENNFLLFETTETLNYLTQSLILSSYAKRTSYGTSITIDYKNLTQLPFGKTTAKNLFKKLQLRLANYSCEFIFSLSKETTEHPYLTDLLKYSETIDSHNRRVLPCYEITKTILLHIKFSKIPILLVVHRLHKNLTRHIDTILFTFSMKKNDFEAHYKNNFVFTDIPCFIIQATTELSHIEPIIKTNLTSMILSNMAKHPEFIAQLPKSFFEKRVMELSKMKKNAETLGFCQENPKFLFLRHIYADTVKNEMNRLMLTKPILTIA